MNQKVNTSGGAAAAGGFGFQAHLGAIAAIHTLRGTPVQWTEGLTRAAPCAVSFETSGPGDDLALELADHDIVEIQARKALRADTRFWSAIDALCEGIHADRCKYGILIVCPNSSIPVRRAYALALRRIGEGRNDSASQEQVTLTRRLAKRGYDAEAVCARVRIQTVAALDDARDAIAAAYAELRHICADDSQVPAAWKALCHDALSAIGSKGRRTVCNLSSCLDGSHVALAAAQNSPAAISDGLRKWTMSRTERFTVPGIKGQLPTDRAWLPLTALVRDASTETAPSVEEALAAYRALAEKSPSVGEAIDAKTIGTFRKRCVVVGGPGSGKSLLLRVLAREFTRDSYVCVRIRLRDLARRIRETGCGVEEGLFQLGLDGTGVSRGLLRAAALPDLVLLCDGLDECGDHQEDIASGLQDISTAHPSYRVVVTTRPIGYGTSELRSWRHYELVPLAEDDAAEHLATLCRFALVNEPESTEKLASRIRAYVEESGASRLLARSPLLLALGAAVLLSWGEPSKTKLQHYRRIFRLLERDRPIRETGIAPPATAVRNSVLHQLGWLTLVSPLSDAEELGKQCAETLQQELSTTFLQALGDVESCVAYWEDRGLIERLQHSGTDLITFIHKTFGEFAAAQHLGGMEPAKARRLTEDVVSSLDWDEILDFAPEAPLATMVAKQLVSGFEAAEPDESELNRLVAVLVRPGVSLSVEERKAFLERLSALAQSEDRREAHGVGLALTEHDLSRIPEVAAVASDLVSSTKEWTRLVGWAVLACHFPGCVRRDELEGVLRHLMERSLDKDFFVGRESRSPFGLLPDRRVFENFMIGALKSLLPGQDMEYQNKLIAEVVRSQPGATMRFVVRLGSLLRELGREDVLPLPWKSDGPFRALNVPRAEDVEAGLAAILTDVVPPAFLRGDAGPLPPTGPKYIGALFALGGILWVPVGDESVWLSDRRQLDSVHRLLRAAASVYELPAERLEAEARQIVGSARRGQEKDFHLLDLLPNVDAPEVDWSRAERVDIDSGLLERLVGHPSQWVQHLAALFLDARLHGEDRRAACERLLHGRSEDALYWAAALTADLPSGSKMLIQRLEGRAEVGLHHLFDHLKEQEYGVSESHLAALESGLINCGAKTAVSAARWCEATASTADTWLLDFLQAASSYWVENEEPYPKRGGAVPDSPREALLRTRCMIAMPAFDELAELAGDSRRDVAGAAIDGILELATSSPEDRLKLVEGILGKKYSARQCQTLLGSSVQYAAEELSNLCVLCEDPDPAFRSVAVRGVLGHPQMNRKEALAVAEAMRSDVDGNVRDTAHRFLERGAKERP